MKLTTAQPPQDRTSRHLIFSLAGRHAAFLLAHVEGVAMLPSLLVLPESPTHVRGLVRLPNRSLPVLDLAAVLGEEVSRFTGETALIYPKGADFAWLVDAVIGLAEADVVRSGEGLTWNDSCQGMIVTERGEAVVLDPGRLLAAEECLRLKEWSRRSEERLGVWEGTAAKT